MHQPSEQLALFTFEPSQNDSLTIPRRWQKTYKSWRGEFEVIRDRKLGIFKAQYFDFSIEIYDPGGGCETVVEITAPLPSEAESLFRRTVDKLADIIANIPCSSVTESLVLDAISNIDSLTLTEVSSGTNNSVTFKDNPVTESLVSDATNDSVTFKDNPVTESLVSDATNDSVTFKDNPVTESLVSDATNDSVTFKDNPVTESLVSDATNDSVTFKDNPVTESLVSDATNDSVTFKDNPVTESLVSDATNDSVTFKDNPVTESLVSDATNDSVTFKDNPVTESLVSDATNDSVTFKDNPVTESLVSDATNDSVTAINIYEAKGTARGNRKYFRYSYKEVGKVKHLHIGGGNIHSLVAQSRMQLVKDALAQGQSPNEIKQLIRQFRN